MARKEKIPEIIWDFCFFWKSVVGYEVPLLHLMNNPLSPHPASTPQNTHTDDLAGLAIKYPSIPWTSWLGYYELRGLLEWAQATQEDLDRLEQDFTKKLSEEWGKLWTLHKTDIQALVSNNNECRTDFQVFCSTGGVDHPYSDLWPTTMIEQDLLSRLQRREIKSTNEMSSIQTVAYSLLWIRFQIAYIKDQKEQKNELKIAALREGLMNTWSLDDDLREIVNKSYQSHRPNLSDRMFEISQGILLDGSTFQKVNWETGRHFDAHGISKNSLWDQLSSLLALLRNGIDSHRSFHSAPFEIPDEYKRWAGAWLWTSWGTCYKDGLAIVVWWYKKKLLWDGIKYVLINDIFEDLLPILIQNFPKYKFWLLSQQCEILKVEDNI